MSKIKRGGSSNDTREFGPQSIETLNKASKHVCYLLNEGYQMKNVSVFVGNHFLLSERQRLAVVRSIASDVQLRQRREKECLKEYSAGKTVHIDGFNCIITLEIALSESLLLHCMDGTIRDLAGLRGTYRLIEETPKAIRLIADTLNDLGIRKAVFYLDAPVSNSGRLKSLIAEVWEDYRAELDILVVNDVDRILQNQECVMTSDSVILDRCKSWFNLTNICVEKTEAAPIRLWK